MAGLSRPTVSMVTTSRSTGLEKTLLGPVYMAGGLEGSDGSNKSVSVADLAPFLIGSCLLTGPCWGCLYIDSFT